MTADRTAAPLAAGVALLERSLGYTLGSLLLVTPADLRRPTPCAGWDLGTLLAHMNDSLQALHEAVAGRHVDLDGAPGSGPGGPDRACCSLPDVPAVTSLRDRACRLLGDWNRVQATDDDLVAVAGRPLTASMVAATGSLEVAVHGWDVAAACGSPRPVPAPLGAELLELAPLFVGPADRGRRFAAPVATAPGAPAGDRLVAYLGRVPG